MVGPSSFWRGPRTFLSVTQEPGGARSNAGSLQAELFCFLVHRFPPFLILSVEYWILCLRCLLHLTVLKAPPFLITNASHPDSKAMTCCWWTALRFLTYDSLIKHLHKHPKPVGILLFIQELCVVDTFVRCELVGRACSVLWQNGQLNQKVPTPPPAQPKWFVLHYSLLT